ncbi:hypothetical protein FI667_g2927, partial [Globisporangium splendens]
MISLVCQVIGSSNDCVELEVGEAVRVAKLKEFIEQKVHFIFPAIKLELYLAKELDNERRDEDHTDQALQEKKQHEWLSEDDIDLLTQEDVSSETLEVYLQKDLFMKPFRTIGHYFGNEGDLKSVPVHVLGKYRHRYANSFRTQWPKTIASSTNGGSSG